MFKLMVIIACIQVGLVVEGKPPINGRIVGGNDTTIAKHPYQVSLEYLSSHVCGGAIISRTWIVTGAQCFPSSLPNNYIVRVGSSFFQLGGEVLNVNRIISHSNYSTVTYDFDIGLVQLREPISLSASARIIGLPDNGNSVIEGSMANVTGWGHKSENAGVPSNILQVARVPIVSRSVCSDIYTDLGYVVTNRMLCAGYWDGGRDACKGDGGGPLVIGSEVVGLVSWGLGCGRPERPGVYTNVGAHRDWITQQTGI